MDLGAYSNIEALSQIAAQNGIHVPRLRGYRLMKDEKPVNYREAMPSFFEYNIVEDLIEARPFWHPHPDFYIVSRRCDTAKKKLYLRENKEGYGGTVRWENIHGWKRKVLKTILHNESVKYKKQYDVWNKYCGREDILYVHARIGGPNWPYYYDEVSPFLDRVDDAFDPTYCDLYFKIKKEDENG